MKKIKVFIALEHLDTYELNRFQKYVSSPYFNKSESLVHTINLFIEHRKKGSTESLSKELLWQTCFPNKAYNDGRLRKVFSDLLKLYEDFLCQELLEKKPIQKATLLMEAVEQRKLDVLYNSSMKRANQLTKDNTDASAQLHYHRFQTEKYYYQLTDFDLKRNVKSNLADIINSLDYFYLAEKLKYYCTSISQKVFIDHGYEFLFIEEIKEHISQHQYSEVPIVNIWISVFFLQTGTKEETDHYFSVFKSTFNHISGSLDIAEAASIFTYGHNFCIRQMNNGREEYFSELFGLYKEALQTGIYVQENTLDPVVFRNIVSVALRLKEYTWTKAFISDYGSMIALEFQINAVQYAKALMSFYLKDYKDVLEHIHNMTVMDLSYELNSKVLMITTYFEMQEVDALDSLLDSFYVYLNRRKDITQNRRDIYLNLISFTRRFMNLAPSDKAGHQKLLDKLDDTKIIGSRAWLKEKIQERLK